MARRVANYTVDKEGRDKGKVFIIEEMASHQAEAWALRATLALIAAGVKLPDGFEHSGMAGWAEIGIHALSGLKWEVAAPLLAEMWECIRIIPDPTRPNIIRQLVDEDVEEVLTRFLLRIEVWKLHTDFFQVAVPSK